MGMYISSDPIGLAGNNPTLYGYVKDINIIIDIFGLSECKIKDETVLRTQEEAIAEAKRRIGLSENEALEFFKNANCGDGQVFGDNTRGYRLDRAHKESTNPNMPDTEKYYDHVNYWDYTKGKRKSGSGIKGHIPYGTRY